jgi:beta-1,4-mannosyl-glycoprotein beta-1,4-N-acetylglucosaminyltransferase
MVYDCFTFFNELDLLELRLNELDGVVDHFVIVEAGKTQSLIDKPFYFEENKSRYEKFLHKIIHVNVEDYPDNKENLWQMENHQRNCISRGLQDANDDDLVLISDADEIPHKEIVKFLDKSLYCQANIEQYNIGRLVSFKMSFHAYYLNLISEGYWIGTVAGRAKEMKEYGHPQFARRAKDHVPQVIGGWHFSWLGGWERIYEKAISCIEPLDKSNLPSKEQYKDFFSGPFIESEQKKFIKTEDLSGTSKSLSKVEINEAFPEYIIENPELFKKFILT